MKQINLRAEGISSKQIAENKAGTFSIVLGMIVLLLSCGSYGVLYYLGQGVDKEIESVKQAQIEKKKQLTDEKYIDMFVFEEKLNLLKTRMEQRVDNIKKIDTVAAYTLPEISINGLTLDGAGVSVKLMATDYDIISRQIKAYSSIEGLKDFSPSSVVKRGPSDPRIDSTIDLDI